MDKQIIDALLRLDPTNDDHWTDAGAPRIDAVAALMGVKATELKRDIITGAAPSLTRQTFAEFVEAQGDDAGADDEGEARSTDNVAALDDEDLRAEFSQRLTNARSELAKLEAAAQEAKRAVQRQQDAIDDIIRERDRAFPPVHPSVAIKQHLQRQLERRVAAATGDKPLVSPLDQRLRGRKRSEARPQALPTG